MPGVSECGSTSSWLGPAFEPPARRLVSLVPSLTHGVFELGAGEIVVGRTEYCIRPVARVAGVPVVGGTKNPDVAAVLALHPDLVLANREENTRRRVERIAEGAPVLLTDPRGPEAVPGLWRALGIVCGRPEAGERHAAEVESELERCRQEPSGAAPRFVYWIWRDPWMAAGPDTYISRLLETAGWRNAVPGGADRYPRLEPSSVHDLGVGVLLFSSEPYGFQLPRDLDAFPPPAHPLEGRWKLGSGAVAVEVDGQLFSWYPSLTAAGLRTARELRLGLERCPPQGQGQRQPQGQ